MNFFKKLWRTLIVPAPSTAVLLYLGTALSAGLALFAVFTKNTDEIWAYCIYAVAAICLFGATVVTVGLIKNGSGFFSKLRGRYAFIEKITEDIYYRKTLTTTMGTAFSLLYAAFIGAVAILGRSAWYGALAVYHLLFAALRAILLKRGKRAKDEEEKARTLAMNGWLLIIFAFALAVTVVLQIAVFGQSFRYAGLLVYAFAAYAFYKLTVSIVGVCKIKKQGDYTVRALIANGFASAAVSILSLQTALLDSFAEVKKGLSFFNGLTGGAVCLLIVAIGLSCLIAGRRKIKELQNGRE